MKKFVILILFLNMFAFCTYSQQYIAGPIYTTTWTDNNPYGVDYIIQGDIYIPSNNTLTIDPNVIIEFDYNAGPPAVYFHLDVYGTIDVNGTANQMVTFTSLYNWNGITVYGSTNEYATFDYCIIEYVIDNPALTVDNVLWPTSYIANSSIRFNNNFITGETAGIACYNGSTFKIFSNDFFQNSNNNNIIPPPVNNPFLPTGTAIDCDNFSNVLILNNYIIQNTNVTPYDPAPSGIREGSGGISCRNNSNASIISDTFYLNTDHAHSGAGAIYVYGSSPIINSNYFQNNTGYSGGAIESRNGSPIITENIIYQNYADRRGGGISEKDGSICYISNNTILENTAYLSGGGIDISNEITGLISHNVINSNHCFDDNSFTTVQRGGGGIAITGSGMGAFVPIDIDIIHNRIQHNTSTTGPNCGNPTYSSNGGGIYINHRWCIVDIKENTITNNIALNDGGGIYDFTMPILGASVIVTINDINKIDSNTAGRYGGGIFTIYNSNISIKRNYIKSNTATAGAGIYSSFENNIPIINNLIVNNFTYSAPGLGGGIYFGAGMTNPIVNNNTIADNQATDGGGLYGFSATGSYFNNILWNNSPNSANGILSNPPNLDYPLFQFCDISGAATLINNNINSDPQFYNTAIEDYRIHWTVPPLSPCIDNGGLTIPPPEPFDLRQKPRIVTYIDMGAFEMTLDINLDPLIILPYNTGVEKDDDNQFSFMLFPNPAETFCNIIFSLSKAENIRIEIFDLNGQSIITLFNGLQNPGKHQVSWDLANFAKGIYYCKLTSNERSPLIKKVIIN